MIPQTAGAVLAFLGLVAPGAIFEMQRENRLIARKRSAFREATAVALASLVFSLVALCLLALVRAALPGVVADPARWFLEGGRYVSSNFYLVAQTLVFVVVLSSGLAFLANYLAGKRGGRQARANLEATSIWHMAIRRDRQPGTNPWVHVKLLSGGSFYGYVKNYSAQIDDSPRGIQLVGPDLCYRSPPIPSGYQPSDDELDRWDSVVIDQKDIEYVKIRHLSIAEANS